MDSRDSAENKNYQKDLAAALPSTQEEDTGRRTSTKPVQI